MAKVTLNRRKDTDRLYLIFANGDGDVARYALPIKLDANQWKDGQVVNHTNRQALNIQLAGILNAAQAEVVNIQMNVPTRNMRAHTLRDRVVAAIFHTDESKEKTFSETFDTFGATHNAERTRELYAITSKRIKEYDKRDLTFDQINVSWLEDFDRFLSKTEDTNTRAIHMRNIRACFNYAIRHDLTECYPFRKFSIRTQETEYRDMSLEELQRLFAYVPPTQRNNKHHSQPLDFAVKYVDTARIMFYLMGINIIDLCKLKPSDYKNGRIRYKRSKTGRIYNIKVEPEAAELLDKYKGTSKLWSPCEGCEDYKNFAHRLNDNLKRISQDMGMEPITTYYIRYTYATLAYQCGMSIDVVSDLLGHKLGNKVTLGYVNKMRTISTIDEAHRKVLDYIK